MTVPTRYYRRSIHIGAIDSPNVALALEEIKRGHKPTYRQVIPGVLPYEEYLKRMNTWDEIRKTIGLLGLFYRGPELLLFPPQWRDRAERLAEVYFQQRLSRRAESIGIDCGEGVADTTMIASDRYGIVEAKSIKTPDPSDIADLAEEFILRHPSVEHERVVLDAGGGGKMAGGYLRKKGFEVTLVGFGETPTLPIKFGKTYVDERIETKEERLSYANLRAQMYYELRERIDPRYEPGFSLPEEYTELHRQMSPIPLWYDKEGRVYLPPKQLPTGKRKGRDDDNATDEITIRKLIGCSPDWVDALVLSVYGMNHVGDSLVLGAYR